MMVITIKSTREIDSIFRSGARVGTPHFLLITTKTPQGRDLNGRVACVAGKRLGNALFRNRCKRVLRETIRRTGARWPGRDVVLVARPSAADARPQDLEASLGKALARLGDL